MELFVVAVAAVVSEGLEHMHVAVLLWAKATPIRPCPKARVWDKDRLQWHTRTVVWMRWVRWEHGARWRVELDSGSGWE